MPGQVSSDALHHSWAITLLYRRAPPDVLILSWRQHLRSEGNGTQRPGQTETLSQNNMVSGDPQTWVPIIKRRHGGLFRPQQPGSSVSSLSEDIGVMPRSTQESFLKGETGQRALGPHFLSDSELI